MGKIFRSDRAGCWDAGRRAIELYAPPHRLDEFPAGYSLAGCAPAEPAAASPAGNHYAAKGRRWPSKTSERSTVSKLFVSPQGASPLDLLAGLDWVYDSIINNNLNPAIKVVNLSLGRTAQNTQLEADIEALIILIMQKGVVVVTAAGNDPNLETHQMFLAKIQDAITVSGTTATVGLNTVDPNLPWVFADTVFGGPVTTFGSTDGSGVDIAAPADERHDLTAGFFFYYGVLSTSLTDPLSPPPVNDLVSRKLPAPGGPFEARGTSNSSALVSGVMARIMQQELEADNLNGDFTDVTSARTIMLLLADRVGTAPFDHPWTVQPFSGVLQTPDLIYEGIAQAPMPLPGP